MRALLILLVVKILESSRFNLNDGSVSRTHYDILSLALATRQIFIALLPFFVIAAWRAKRIKIPAIAAFSAGLLAGFFPALLFPHSFILNLIRPYQFMSMRPKNRFFLMHSLGLSYYFSDHKWMATLMSLALLIALYLIAIKYLHEKNLWLFLAAELFAFLFFILSSYRPEPLAWLTYCASISSSQGLTLYDQG
jgi:hypothetical protein